MADLTKDERAVYILDRWREVLTRLAKGPATEPHPDCPHGEPLHDHGDGCPSCHGVDDGR